MSKIQSQDLINFLKKPTFTNDSSVKISWFYWLILICGTQFFGMCVGFIANFSLTKMGYQGEHAVLTELVTTPTWVFFLLLAVQAPITEELTFRLFLKPSPKKWLISFFGLVFYLQTILIDFGIGFKYEYFGWRNYLVFALLYSLIACLVVVFFWKLFPQLKLLLESIFQKYFGWIFYISSVSFGLIHIGNYTNLGQLWWMGPFLVLPQTLIGIIMAYIRLRVGFKWSILSHSFYNAVISIPVLLLSLLPRDLFESLINEQDFEKNMKLMQNISKFEESILSLSGLFYLLILFFGLVSFSLLVSNYIKSRSLLKGTRDH